MISAGQQPSCFLDVDHQKLDMPSGTKHEIFRCPLKKKHGGPENPKARRHTAPFFKQKCTCFPASLCGVLNFCWQSASSSLLPLLLLVVLLLLPPSSLILPHITAISINFSLSHSSLSTCLHDQLLSINLSLSLSSVSTSL